MTDRDNLIEYLRRSGGITTDKGEYHGSTRRGYETPPGAGQNAGKRSDPLALGDLLGSKDGFYLQQDYDYQNSMFQIQGGTDRLPRAFAARLKDRITYRAPVKEIRQRPSGVSVVYAGHDGRPRRLEADYCACTIPLSVLGKIDADFSPEFKKAIAAVTYASAGKIGLQFKRRFWEEDDTIYGGHSSTDQDIAQIVYPSFGFHGRKGVLIGYYIQGQGAKPMGEKTPAERQEAALEQGSRIHPQYRKEFETAFSVAWHKVPWNLGSWSSLSAEARRDAYPLLLKPDGRVHLAGDHLTNWNAWMQGALDSGRAVATDIHKRAGQENRPSAAGG
jgi:monoamine oxidase